MGQLHELLAVEGDLKGKKEKILNETINTFSKKEEHFKGTSRKLEMFDPERKQEEVETVSPLVTTVKDKLSYMSTYFCDYWNAKLQKEKANQEAKADISIDGFNFADLPVTFLLSMEEELKQLRKIYESIPTLAPSIEWVKDEEFGQDVWKSKEPVIKMKTEKTKSYPIIVKADEHHPAQFVEEVTEKAIGKYVDRQWCGMLSSAEKSRMLSRLDNILRAFKKARQRANNQEVSKLKIGQLIFSYIHSPE